MQIKCNDQEKRCNELGFLCREKQFIDKEKFYQQTQIKEHGNQCPLIWMLREIFMFPTGATTVLGCLKKWPGCLGPIFRKQVIPLYIIRECG